MSQRISRLVLAVAAVFALALAPSASADEPSPPPKPVQLETWLNTTCTWIEGWYGTCWGMERGYGWDGNEKAAPKSFAPGAGHACEIYLDDTLTCGGWNEFGQATVPAGLGPVKRVAPGWGHTCAQLRSDEIRCWGRLSEIGLSPSMGVVSDVEQLRSGPSWTCARKSSGSLQCWGVLGPTNWGDTRVPSDLPPADDYSIGWGFQCARFTAGGFRCWGDEWARQNSRIPTDLGAVSAIKTGDGQVCALREDGSVACWGLLTNSGDAFVPDDLPPATAIGAGYDRACAVVTQGALRCWGRGVPPEIASNPQPLTLTTPITVSGERYGTNSFGSASAKASFATGVVGARYRCSVDSDPFIDCADQFELSKRAPGPHQLRVWALDPVTMRNAVFATAFDIAGPRWKRSPRATRTRVGWTIAVGPALSVGTDSRAKAKGYIAQVTKRPSRPTESLPTPTSPNDPGNGMPYGESLRVGGSNKPTWVRVGNRFGIWSAWTAIR